MILLLLLNSSSISALGLLCGRPVFDRGPDTPSAVKLMFKDGLLVEKTVMDLIEKSVKSNEGSIYTFLSNLCAISFISIHFKELRHQEVRWFSLGLVTRSDLYGAAPQPHGMAGDAYGQF